MVICFQFLPYIANCDDVESAIVFATQIYPYDLAIPRYFNGTKWLSYRDTILEQSQQRRQFGTDKLQGSTKVEIPVTEAVSMKPFESRAYIRRSQAALEISNESLAENIR